MFDRLALIVAKFGSLDFDAVLGAPGDTIAKGRPTAISLLFSPVAIGKSAQVPLHVWLPDAMAALRPVSALIPRDDGHGGVYLVGPEAPLFRALRRGLTVVLMVGLVTLCSLRRAPWLGRIKRVLRIHREPARVHFMAAGMRFYTGGAAVPARRPLFYKRVMFLGRLRDAGMHE